MRKIKVKFLRYKTVLMAEVIDFPVELRGTCFLTKNEDDYKLSSTSCPDISFDGKTLFLAGTESQYDQLVALCRYATEEAAIDAMNAFIKLIQDYNDTLAEDTFDCTTALLDVKIAQ